MELKDRALVSRISEAVSTSHGFIVLQEQEGYLPQLILMEIAASLQVGLVENSFFCLIGFLHFAMLLLEALGTF